MPYKLLALDLDYTLLNEELRISDRNKEAVRKAVQEGILVTIATGRMYQSTLEYARELQLDLPLVTYHGALIKKASGGEVIRHCTVPKDVAVDALVFARKKGYHVNLYLEDKLYVEEENDNTRFYQSIANVNVNPVGPLETFLKEAPVEPTKVAFLCRDARFAQMSESLKELFGRQLSILQSRPHFIELTHPGATKGKALATLGQIFDIKREEMAAVGDSPNDLDMLQYVGMGAAVANAQEDIKAAADLITLSHEEDGVAYFIENYLLKRGS